jgi:hypothetical protein
MDLGAAIRLQPSPQLTTGGILIEAPASPHTHGNPPLAEHLPKALNPLGARPLEGFLFNGVVRDQVHMTLETTNEVG